VTLSVVTERRLAFDGVFLFGFFLRLWGDGFGFGVAAVDDLPVLEERDHAYAAADVAGHGGEEPGEVAAPCGFADEDGGHDLAAGGDAVSEVTEADDEGQHPDDHDRAGDGVRAGDEPGYCGDDPAAHDAAPEDGGGGVVEGFEAEAGECLHDLGLERVSEGNDGGEGECTEDVGGENGGPQAEGVPEVLFFGKDKGDGIERVFGEELRTAEDDDDEAKRVEHLGDEENFAGRSGAGGGEECDGDGVSERGEAHEDAAGEAGDGEGDAGAAELLTGVVGYLLVDVLCAGALEILLRFLAGRRLGRVAAKAIRHKD
jgi:hypothetical protein